jgi:hypothetical protein
MLGAMLILSSLDAVPGWLSGRPRGVMAVGSIDAAESALRVRLWIPAYFPDSLRWPPAGVELYPGPPAAVALTFVGSNRSNQRVVLCQTVDASAGIPVKLLPPGLILESARTTVGDWPATLMRIQLDDGRLAHEVIWDAGGRNLALRSDGTLEQLMALARSVNANRR